MFIPPPLIYVVVFLASLLIQNLLPLDRTFFYSPIAANLGIVFIICAIVFMITSLIQFIQSKNSIIPNRSANSLQTKGIFSISRNPMYLGLMLLYLGIAIVKGNWWTIILIPVLVFIIQDFIIKKEEAYLRRAFGQDYDEYKKRVRRWI